MTADRLRGLDRYFAERADQPFGDVESVSGKTLQPFSIAGLRAASNLLAKALRALDDDDVDRARAYVDRAIRLPYDRHEEAHPAAFEAHMKLFCLVTDTLEDSDEHDSRWLDAALSVLSTADDAGRWTMRDVLMAVDQDFGLYGRERTTLRSAVEGIPNRPELRDLELPPQELGESVMSVLAACRAYRLALAIPS